MKKERRAAVHAIAPLAGAAAVYCAAFLTLAFVDWLRIPISNDAAGIGGIIRYTKLLTIKN